MYRIADEWQEGKFFIPLHDFWKLMGRIKLIYHAFAQTKQRDD